MLHHLTSPSLFRGCAPIITSALSRLLSVTKLTEKIEGLPQLKSISHFPIQKPMVSRSSKGVKMVSQESYDPITAIQVFVSAGSSHEEPTMYGASSCISNLAFADTHNVSRDQMQSKLIEVGAQTSSIFDRDDIIYTLEVPHESIEEAFDLLSQTVLLPRFTDEGIVDSKLSSDYVLYSAMTDSTKALNELMMVSAFGKDSPKGHSIIRPSVLIPSTINPSSLTQFHKMFYTPSRITVSGVGLSHDKLKSLVEKYFTPHQAVEDPSRVKRIVKQDVVDANFKRNMLVVDPTLLGFPDPNLTTIAMIYPTPSLSHADYVTSSVFNTMLGGGSSFSEGGPGKGLYTILSQNLLYQHQWVDKCGTLIGTCGDQFVTGIFGTMPSGYESLFMPLVKEQLDMIAAGKFSDTLLTLARNQSKGNSLMSTENRAFLAYDYCKQVHDYFDTPIDLDELCKKIDSVSKKDITNYAQKLLQSPMGIAGFGKGMITKYINKQVEKITGSKIDSKNVFESLF